MKQRALPCAAFAHDGKLLALRHFQFEIAENHHLARPER